ncbi:hypothetical protein D9M73_182990 [compost metagenome]
MLLASLQGHAQGHVAARILGHANDPPGNGALELVPASEIRRMRPAIAHRHAKALGGAKDHVGPQFAGRGQQDQAEQVRRDASQRLLVMQLLDQWPQVMDFAVSVGVLQQRTEHLVLTQVIHRVDDQLEPEAFGTGLHHGKRLRMAVLVDEEQITLRFGHALGQGHGLGGRGCLVEQ